MGKQYRIIDVARRIIELYGLVPEADIPIEITGLRPGEKLYEELFYDRAHLSNTPNEKIFVLRDDASSLDNRAIEEAIRSGFSRLLSCGRAEFRKELKKLVPEYRYDERTDESIPLFKLVN
jgi:FlaA1/EpsC-like NDP-sugar epimerase